MLKIVNRDAVDILRGVSRNSGLGVRELARLLSKSTKTIVSAAETFEKLGFVSCDHMKVGEVGRPKSVLKLTKTGRDFLRFSRLLNLQGEGLLASGSISRCYQFIGLDPLEAISRLEKYYVSGLLALLDQTHDFIPSVKSIYIVVDPSGKNDMNLISNWFSDEYRFTPRFQPLGGETSASGEDRNKSYEVREINCLEKDGTVELKVATTERAIVDSIADFELDPGTAIQAIYILLENRHLDYTGLREIAEKRGRAALSRIGFIFNLANEMLYGSRPSYRFPETFPTDMEYDEENPFTVQVKGAVIRVFNLP